MTAAEFLNYPTLLGALLLIWAALVRRSQFDCGLLALAGLLLIFLTARLFIGAGPGSVVGVIPELALAVLSVVMLVRAIFSPLGCVHRIFMILAALLVLLPFLFLVGLIMLFGGVLTR